MATLRSDSPVQYIKGVGPVRARAFASLGLETVGQLLEYFPFRYEVESGELDIADLRPNMNATVRGAVTRISGGGWRRSSMSAEIHDGTEACRLRWFHQPPGAGGLYIGATVIASGNTREYNNCVEIVQPRVHVFEPDAVVLSGDRGRRRVGVYRGNAQIKSPLIRRAVLNALAQAELPADEFLPAELLRAHKLPARAAAVREIHSPTGDAKLEQARARMAYEEFLLLELAMAIRRRKTVALEVGQKLHVTPEVDRRIRARFPFKLTPSQDSVVQDIAADIQSGRPMTRLLQGDVGSGKTVVALYACLAAIANGKQAAVMAPTEILAQQHFANIESYLAGSRVRYALLRGGLGKKQRGEALAAIERGEIDLVVGTQALIQSDVAFNNLAMVVVDEQHKFGVLQRAAFRTKGPMPHYLVMTATPIPRTLSMTVFGDLDVSIIRHGPPGRGRITTKIVKRQQWATVMAYVRRRLEAGEQAYVVCPVIGGEEGTKARRHGGTKGVGSAMRTNTLVSAKEAYDRLTAGPWRGLDVGLLHGGLKSADKQRAIGDFAAGRLHALVATTVVEVGVDVANATIMIVEHADRFGLSQLHQLRGRIGRGSKDSLCVLISHGRSAKSAERLEVMADTTDGFKIAEADLRQRGPGELFGTRQHGLPELRFGDIVEDFAMLEKARADAFDIIRRDPALEQPTHRVLIPPLKRLFGGKLSLIDAA